MNADPLIANEVQPAQTVAAMVRADERLKKEFSLHHPAGAHPARHGRQGHQAERQPASSTRRPARRDKTLKLYEGHFHDLLNDIGKAGRDGRSDGRWGLRGMRERARRIGASLEIRSRPNAGTEVELRVPAAEAYLGVTRAWWPRLRRMASGGGVS